MAVLAYLIAILAIVSGIVLALERITITPEIDALRTAAERGGLVKPPAATVDAGGSGMLSPVYPATPGKELLAARARQQGAGATAKKPKPRHDVGVKRQPEHAVASRADQSATLGYAPEPAPPPPVFNRNIAY